MQAPVEDQEGDRLAWEELVPQGLQARPSLEELQSNPFSLRRRQRNSHQRSTSLESLCAMHLCSGDASSSLSAEDLEPHAPAGRDLQIHAQHCRCSQCECSRKCSEHTQPADMLDDKYRIRRLKCFRCHVQMCPSFMVLVMAVVMWPMDRIGNADAYTLDQVRRADYATNCGLGFAGLHCNEVMTCEELDYCSGHGICQRGGYCICDTGWEGPSCKQSYCPSECSGHGSCAATGGCVCDAGFTGIICDKVICLGGGNCTGHGVCLPGGMCSCEKGYLGGACDVIDSAEKCSNHGFPDEHGNCNCDLWFTGPDCSLALCMNNCSDHGACDSQTGICWCDPGWTAGDCSKQLCYNNCTGHGTCFEGSCQCQDGYTGDDCSIFPCLNGCSGHGACYNGTCACDHLYAGQDCSIYSGYLIECPGNCTGRGTCMNATCQCDPGWTGLDCTASVDCPGNCTGHGMCYNATCACDVGFSGYDCATSHCLNNCTLHGTCTSNGTCACDPSWHGPDCSLPDLTCGSGSYGNCSGHGTCIDSALNQWWSGSSTLPDMWAWEEPSKHLVRRDVSTMGEKDLGKCSVDFYGIPSVVESQTLTAVAQSQRVMKSNGIPDHFVMHNGFPLCEVTWSIFVPQQPKMSTGPCDHHWPLPRDATCPHPYPLPSDSPIGYALNGVPIWGPLLSDGSNAVEGPDPVPCYGHSSRTGMWHYHHPILGCNMAANQETLIGYALDGFPIYGPLPGPKSVVDAVLDVCNGRALEDGSYRYHVRTLAQVNEQAPYQATDKDPRNVMGPIVHNNWNYVLGCFSGKPAASLGLRQIIVPLMASSDDWIAGHDNSALSTDSIAQQLGLSERVGLCMCDAGWVGLDCRSMGCLNNCSGNGLCEATGTEAHCICDNRFTGEDCSNPINASCSQGCSGHGTCLWENYLNATCFCDPGWSGYNCEDLVGTPCPYNCSGHGSCVNETCVCDHMFEGEGCESPSAYALNLNSTLCWQWIGNRFTNNSCAGRGTCFNGTCICDAGWTGINCTLPNVPNPLYIDCPSNCSFHGACTHIFDPVHASYNGTCICDVGYDGPDCSLDWGEHQCDGNCSAHGSCVNKTCICDPGWDGYDCMNRWVSPYLLCPMNCSDHGSCFNGSCSCDLGWSGSNCSLPDPCPGDCSGHGVCSLGNCTCDPEWAGADCSHPSYCPGFLPDLGVNCSGHGVCLNGNCSCELQWGGYDCSIPGCINSCSNQGVCRNGTCDCFVGFIGEDCSLGPYNGECPGQCSGHGACSIVESKKLPYGISDVNNDGILWGNIACVCDEGWGGSDCTVRTCPNDCSGNGACAQNGTCFCYRNWGGDDCSTAWCPNACSNHGTCIGGEGCLCDVGYEGLDCGLSACPNNCTGRGICLATPGVEYGDARYGDDAEQGYDVAMNKTSSGCLCFYGWGGLDCSQITCPLNCSYPNGFCNNGTCVCDMSLGYYGRNCSEQFGVVSLIKDGSGLTPSYGIFEGFTLVTVRGNGFVNSDTMRCKFGSRLSVAERVVPNPPEVPYALCRSPGEATPYMDGVFFQFSLDGRVWTEQDSRLKFIYHGNGIVTAVRWPMAPEQGGNEVTFYGINFQFAIGVKCKFGDFEVFGTFNTRFIEDPVTKNQVKEAQLTCRAPALAALELPDSAAATVMLQVSMNSGQNWMRYEKDYLFQYYGVKQISPSFGPRQDQKTIIYVYGFNFFQGENRKDLFPGFTYDYTCSFKFPADEEPVLVKSQVTSWKLVKAPYTGSSFGCAVPPGRVGTNGYAGPVDVGVSLNPCIYDPSDTNKEFACIYSLPFTTETISFNYRENTVNTISTTLGPRLGGTAVTISGNFFNLRDESKLVPAVEHKPVLCKWGTEQTIGTFISEQMLVRCVSPACTAESCASLLHSTCPSCVAPVRLEVALNGLDFTDSRVNFFFFQDPQIQGISPSLGSVLGGTTVTIQALGFHDPCVGCIQRSDCLTCSKLIKCKFQAFDRVEYTPGVLLTAEDRNKVRCPSPPGRVLRGNVVSLDPFYVALSVTINDQQFFPINTAADNQPYNVYDPQCTGGRTTGCAFFFKYYERPILYSVSPTVIGGSGGGRITITGTNFLNENHLRCMYGNVAGPPACISGATGDFSLVSAPGQCVGPDKESPIFISKNMVICGTINLESLTSSSGSRVSQTSVGVSFNGGAGEFDTSWITDIGGNMKEDAVQVYWVLSIQPSLGFMKGGTRVTVTGVNLEALSIGGDNSLMRCQFDGKTVESDPKQSPDPVDFQQGNIECTSPASFVSTGQKEVIFGICLLGPQCEYTGISRQAETAKVLMPEINHFTKRTKFLYYQAPTLTSLTPSLGPRVGSTLVTVRGAGFFQSPVLSCRFDLGHYSTVSTLVSSSLVVCQTPPITAGSYNLDFTLNGQQYSAGCGSSGQCRFLSYIEPIVTFVNPQAGINTGQSLVILTVENPVLNYYGLSCKFQAAFAPDKERLEIANFDLVTDASVTGNLVQCFSPTTLPYDGGIPMLHTPLPSKPTQGLTYISVSWNGQQFGPYDEAVDTQKFWYHDAVETISAVPSGGRTVDSQTVTIFGANFVNTISLRVQFGENYVLCPKGALMSECPPGQKTFERDAVTFISPEELQIKVPANSIPARKIIKVANSIPFYSVSSAAFEFFTSSDVCPRQCRGVAPDGADPHGACSQVGTGYGCVCKLGYKGYDCSVGPNVIKLEPSVGLATGGYHVTVIGRNIWTSDVPTTGNTFKVRISGGGKLVYLTALKATAGCDPDCENKLVFRVPTSADTEGPMVEVPTGARVEITVNGEDYTENQRLLQLMGTPVVSQIVPNGAHYSGNVRVTVTGNNFIDSNTIRIRLGQGSPKCTSELCLRAIFISNTQLVFSSLPCKGNCSFHTSLLLKIALNGIDFVDTGKYFRFLENTTLTKLTPRVGSVSGGTPVTINATNQNFTTGFSCMFGDKTVLGRLDSGTSRAICDSPPSSRGNGTVPVRIALDGQNFSPSPDCQLEPTKCFVYKNPLEALSVYPTLGPISGGTKITILGNGFYTLEGVQGLCRFSLKDVGTLETHMTFIDSNHFTCESPSDSRIVPATYDFQFAANGADFDGSYQFIFFVHPQLVASSGSTVVPVGSSFVGGTSVTIGGSGFINSTDGIYVRWEDSDVGTSFISNKATFVSETEISVKTSAYPHDFGRSKSLTRLSVSLNGGIDFSPPAADTFTWYKTPTLTDLIPGLGPRLGETSVVIQGSDFVDLRGVAKCKFGQVEVRAIYEPMLELFKCISPPSGLPDWVNVEIALDGQVYTEAKITKFQYYGEYDIFSARPAGGPKAGGTEITITGVGLFMSGLYLQCFFGAGKRACRRGEIFYDSSSDASKCYVSTAAVYKSPTQVTCIAPPMPDGGKVTDVYPISVALNGQFSQSCPNAKTAYQCALKSGLAFTYYDDVYVTGISPNSGQVMGGTELTVFGSNFRSDLASRTRCMFTRCTGSDVFLSGDNAGQFRDPLSKRCTGEVIESPSAPGDVGVISSTVIRCLAPLASTADTHFALVDISLNRGITNQYKYGPECMNGCPVSYLFYALPQLSFNSPSIGPLTGATTVTVIGVGFFGTQNTNMRCKFGDIDSPSVKYVTESSIVCVAPKQAALTLRIQVSLNGLDSDFTKPEFGSVFTFYDEPKLLDRPTPSAGPTTGGTSVTIKGSGFIDGGLKCKFWTGPAKGNMDKRVSAQFLTSTSATCETPPVTQSQLVSVSLALNGQDYSPFFLEDLFYYYPAPKVVALHPSVGPAQSGGWTLVEGQNFIQTLSLKCRVGVIEAEAQYINSSFVRCVTPQIQPKSYSPAVLALGTIIPQQLPETFISYPIQGYPLELSFDGQTFSADGRKYEYYHTPNVDVISPSRGPKTAFTSVAVLTGANFRNDFGGPFCRFGGVGNVRAVFMTDRTIRCQIPSVSLGKTVIVEVSINGQQYEDHSSTTYSFMGAAPILQKADLTENFDRIQVIFDSNTNMAQQGGTFPCTNILSIKKEDLLLSTSGLSASQLQALGTQPTAEAMFQALYGTSANNYVSCRFESNQTVSIILGAYPKFKLGHPIALKEQLFMQGNELSYFASGNVTIRSPRAPPKPVSLLSAPRQVGACDSLEIDAAQSYGGLGRALYFSWVLDQLQSRIIDDNLLPSQKQVSMDKLAQAVADFSGRAFDASGIDCRNPACFTPAKNGSAAFYKNCYCNVIKIPFAEYPPGLYTVQLMVSNWQGGGSDAASVTIEKTVMRVPTVSINLFTATGARALYVNRSLTIPSIAFASKCTSSPTTLLYRWAILDGQGLGVNLGSSVNTQAASLVLPAYSLAAGRSYSAKLEVTASTDGCMIPPPPPAVCQDTDSTKCCFVGLDTVNLQTSVSDPLARIKGSELTVSSSMQLLIDGSDSFHPDFDSSLQPSTLSFEWSCREIPSSGNIVSETCLNSQGVEFGQGTASKLTIPANSFRPGVLSYDFTLKVSYGARWSTAAIRVHPVTVNVPLVIVSAQDKKTRYPPNSKISFLSTVVPVSASAQMTYRWTTAVGDVDLSKSQFLESANSRQASLVISRNVLTPGQRYTVRLTVTEDGKTGSDQITFQMDYPPSGGVFEVLRIESAMDNEFQLSALNWQVEADTLPVLYSYEYLKLGTTQIRVLKEPSEKSRVTKMLPPAPASTDHFWALQLRISNILGSETLVKSCNLYTGPCVVKVMPVVYENNANMLADIQQRVSIVDELIANGDPNAAINYVTILLAIMNGAAGGNRRRFLLGDGANANMKCGTLAPLISNSLPSGGIVGHPSAASLARNSIASLLELFAVQADINDNCMTEMFKVCNSVLNYLAAGSPTIWASEPDMVVLQDFTNLLALATGAVSHLRTEGSISNSTAATHVSTLISHQESLNAIRIYGSIAGEAAKSLDSTLQRSKVWRLQTPTTSLRRRIPFVSSDTEAAMIRMYSDAEPAGVDARRKLFAMTAGTTKIPAWSGSFTQSVWSLDATTLPFKIDQIKIPAGSNGMTLSEVASVSAVATHYLNFYNPYFYSSDASHVISSVLSLQVQAFGVYKETVPLTNMSSPITLDFTLKKVPSALKDEQGKHMVPACAVWDGSRWAFEGCGQPATLQQADSGGQDMRGICKCTTVGTHAVLELPAGCDGVAFSTKVYDVCRVCGGDGSSCKGCDGIPNSGAEYDGCKTKENPKGICGGDGSTCSGCDGVPNSGTVFDECSVCGGDNSTCMGCDGIAVHPLVTARTGLRPKAYDRCKSAQNPLGVCGGCDTSCRGCDGVVNSGKLYDKCGKCGDFENEQQAILAGVAPDAWYSRLTADQCELGLKQCAVGFVPDSCGTCIPFGSGPDVRDKECKGCDGVAAVFSYQNSQKQAGGKTLDRCGVCGGNDCSCIDCKGVVGGSAKYDRCGVCEGNNTCLDCLGTPYGSKVRDVCGICGGSNDTRNCLGCDGKLHPKPLIPPQFDRYFTCCAVSQVGCNNTCYASVGCDGICAKNATAMDDCGICDGKNLPNTGTCDCAGVPNGKSRIGCDGVCRNPPLVLDICGVCGGTNKSETGTCDCEGIPHGAAIRDTAGVCCYLSDMGCGSKNQSRCFSGKTWDICNTCGGDGGTCASTRPSTASRLSQWVSGNLIAFAVSLVLALHATMQHQD